MFSQDRSYLYIHVPSNLQIFSIYYIIIVKNILRAQTKCIYLESARRDLQNGAKIFFKTFSW